MESPPFTKQHFLQSCILSMLFFFYFFKKRIIRKSWSLSNQCSIEKIARFFSEIGVFSAFHPEACPTGQFYSKLNPSNRSLDQRQLTSLYYSPSFPLSPHSCSVQPINPPKQWLYFCHLGFLSQPSGSRAVLPKEAVGAHRTSHCCFWQQL